LAVNKGRLSGSDMLNVKTIFIGLSIRKVYRLEKNGKEDRGKTEHWFTCKMTVTVRVSDIILVTDRN